MRKTILLFFFIAVFFNLYSQPSISHPDTLRNDALKVFMDATDYIRKEIPWVNYVRDINDASVYIISTRDRTGSGGSSFTYFFVGQNENAGMRDTLSFVTTPDETMEGRREKEVNTIKMGLMRYMARTPLAKYMKISFSEPLSPTVPTDNWDSWVVRTSLNGSFDGQKTYRSSYLSGNISGSRVTEKWKININTHYSHSGSKFIIEDTDGNDEILSTNSSKSLSALIVKSISDHWSVGGWASGSSSSYSNEEASFEIMPGIEYDLFPYSEATRRQLRLLYRAGFNNVNYVDSTIYDKTKENLWHHSFSVAYEVIQKWGSIDLNMFYRNFLHDWSKNNLSFNGYFNLRIAKGLQANFGGGASIIHDQLGLVKEDVPTEEILLRRKELATQYSYYSHFGFTYTFGSIYNNVVNPRFGN